MISKKSDRLVGFFALNGLLLTILVLSLLSSWWFSAIAAASIFLGLFVCMWGSHSEQKRLLVFLLIYLIPFLLLLHVVVYEQ